MLAFVKDGKYRIKVLQYLRDNPRLSSEIASYLAIKPASTSRILRDLKDKGLVNSISENTRTVLYSLSDKGKKILEVLKWVMR